MEAMDEFQEADILWPDTEDELLAPFAPMDTEEELYEAAAGSVSSVALAPPVFRRRFQGFFLSGGAASPSSSSSLWAGASLDADDEWQEADVLWPDETRGSGASMSPFPGGSSCSGMASRRRRVKPAAASRDGWTTAPARSSPIDIPEDNVGRRRLIRTPMNRRRS